MSRTLVQNSADPKQVKAAEQKEKIREEQTVNDLRTLMNTAHGRRFIRRLIVDVCGRDRSTYINGPTGRDSDKDFLEGGRNIGLQVLAEVREACPEQWLLTEKEHYETLRMEGLEK